MPFSPQTLDFLFENKMHDSRDWYHAHKSQYTELVTKPFTEIIETISPVMNDIDSLMECTPKRISRVFRDTRFSKDKALFRDNIWCTIGRPKCERELPAFYVDISANGIFYGCGYYNTPKNVMEQIRSMILKGDKKFRTAFACIEASKDFSLGGDMYKRNHYPEHEEIICSWLNRKNIFAFSEIRDFDLIFSSELGAVLGKKLAVLKPFYEFLIAADDAAVKAEAEKYSS